MAAPAFVEDSFIYPMMIELSACLCTEIEASGLPIPCFCGLLPGGDTPFDYCGECDGNGCGGQAWVRLTSAYPSTDFPQIDDLEATCSTRIAFDLEVGITRCAPAMDADGNAPTLEAELAATRLQLADMAAIRRAIACCFGSVQNPDDPYSTHQYVLGSYTPFPVSGGCLGGAWAVTTW